MFIQVIEGRSNDPVGVHRRLEVWERDLMPGAVGFLGSTAGCAASGECILVARFESAQAARDNSRRPEQDAWWRATEPMFDGGVTFRDTDDVRVMEHGNLDTAHFVQVMHGRVGLRSRADELAREADPMLAEFRPDLLGVVSAFFGDGQFTELAYFTNEHEARANERKQPPPEAAAAFAEWQEVMKAERYLDIGEPWLVSAESGFAAQ